MPVKPRIKFAPGKTYVYSGSEGVYSVIAGELLEGDSVAAGGNLSHGSGAPSAADGKDGDVYLDLTDFKVHTKGSGAWGSGTLFKGATGSAGSAGAKGDTGTGGTKGDAGNNGLRGKITLEGSGAPGTGSNLATPTAALTDALTDASLTSGDLATGDIYLDTTNHRFYKKTSLGWATRGATFVGTAGSKGDTGTTGTKGDTGTTGTKGDAGLRGKVTLEGAGAPGTGSNLATPTAALADALTDASLTSGDLDVGDLYLDTTNHRFYKKTSLGWAVRGLTFLGPTGTKGDTGTTGTTGTKGDTGTTGAKGDGVNKYSSALTADTYLSTGSTASASTTSSSAFYPASLNLTDLMEDVGDVVTRSSITYNRSASATATGSRFSIDSAGRYKIDFFATFNVTTANSNTNTVNLNAGIYYSTSNGSTWAALQTQTAAFNTDSSATAQTTLELSKTTFLPADTKIEFRASRGASTVSTIVSVNAVAKDEVGEDTFVVIQKL